MPGRPILVAVAVAVAAFALVATGCGGASPASHVAQLETSTSPTSPTRRGSTHDQALAYAGCIRSHGVPLWPDPASSGAFDKSMLTPQHLGVSTVQIGTAEKACKSLVPTYSVAQQSHVLTQALTFSRCMRTHGATNFPDPESNGAIAIPHSMESSPTYLSALHFCLHKYGAPPPPSPAG
ncbi:MAG TPA: hypothetical protein VGL84_07115 [Gaiellaceae bacterium]